ncbi:MAG TPA: hypothetical protein VHA57_10720 [Actinomycetota bacterium]|nr:hypothetical protein [Actinomycetota bacterium]
MHRKVAVGFLGIVAMLAGCAKTTTSPPPGATSSHAPASTSPARSASPSPSSTAATVTVVVHTGSATVAGAAQTVLTSVTGLTLYLHTTDTPAAVCSGTCALSWPPLLLASGMPASSVALPGALGVESDVNGRQVTYNGHPLYGWKNDTSPGQATGQGINNFFAVTVTVAGP